MLGRLIWGVIRMAKGLIKIEINELDSGFQARIIDAISNVTSPIFNTKKQLNKWLKDTKKSMGIKEKDIEVEK